jgi:hypothetical protein
MTGPADTSSEEDEERSDREHIARTGQPNATGSATPREQLITDPDEASVEDDADQPATTAAPEPADTDHPTGQEQAEHNRQTESPS